MPLDPRSPNYLAALDGFITDVETLMREKLKGIGDYKNLAEIEGEIDRITLRLEILGTDPEFQEVVKRLDLKRQDVSRKRDQMKPFLLKLERELALYQAARAGSAPPPAEAPAPAAMAFSPAGPVAPAPMAAAPVAAAAAPAAWAAPAPAPVAAAPVRATQPPAAAPAPLMAPTPMPRPAAPQPPVAQAWPEPAAPAAAPSGPPMIDMSLPDDDGSSDSSFLSPATDFITGPGVTDGAFAGDSGELMLEAESVVENAAPPAPASAAPVSAGAQWPPPGQNIPDPFAAFQSGKPPVAAPVAAPAAASAPRPPVAAAAAPRPPSATPAPARSPVPPPVPPAGPARPPAGPPSQAGVRPPAPPPVSGAPAPAAGGPAKAPPWQK